MIIKNIQDVGGYFEGYFKSVLFDDEMLIVLENMEDLNYAEKCVEDFNSLSENVVKNIFEKSIEFFKDMYSQYADDYDEDCSPENLTYENVFEYVEGIQLTVGTPENKEVLAYNVEILCPIDCPVCSVKNSKPVYLGEDMGMSPFQDFSKCEKNYIKE